MKKLIIVVGIICAAVVSQGASIGWTMGGGTDYKGCDYSIFVIGQNGVSSVAQLQGIIAAGGLSSASDYAFGSGSVLASGAISATPAGSGKSIEWTGPGAEVYTGVIFVQNAAGDKATYTGTATVTLENNSTGKSFAFANQATNLTNNSFTVNTPEPTTGVLLLLGMAGLALKRKRS